MAWPVLGERWRNLYSTVQNRFSTCLPGENPDGRTLRNIELDGREEKKSIKGGPSGVGVGVWGWVTW